MFLCFYISFRSMNLWYQTMTCTWRRECLMTSKYVTGALSSSNPFNSLPLQPSICYRDVFFKKMAWVIPLQMEYYEFVDPLLKVCLCNCTVLLGVFLPFILSVQKTNYMHGWFLPLFTFLQYVFFCHRIPLCSMTKLVNLISG